MTPQKWDVELVAITAAEITEEAVEQINRELVGTAPMVSHTKHSLRVCLCIEAMPSGFFTGLEAASNAVIGKVSTAAAVAGVNPVTYTELKLTQKKNSEAPSGAPATQNQKASS